MCDVCAIDVLVSIFDVLCVWYMVSLCDVVCCSVCRVRYGGLVFDRARLVGDSVVCCLCGF